MKVDTPAPGIAGDYFHYCHRFGATIIMTKLLQESNLRELQENNVSIFKRDKMQRLF